MSWTQLYLRPYLFNNNNITFSSYSGSKQSYTLLHVLFKLRLKALKDNVMVYNVWLHKGCMFNILGVTLTWGVY